MSYTDTKPHTYIYILIEKARGKPRETSPYRLGPYACAGQYGQAKRNFTLTSTVNALLLSIFTEFCHVIDKPTKRKKLMYFFFKAKVI